jgi:hypothetical protein
VAKELLLYNFTISMPRGKPSLRVGRVYVRWDSYVKPCIDIEVDDVDLLVEFLNVLLTKTNWNELQDYGFPPSTTETATTTQDDDVDASKTVNSFIRFNSIDLSKNMTVTVKSRPLKKDLRIFRFDMDDTDDFNTLIQQASDLNLLETGRRGCSIDELVLLLKNYMVKKVRSFAIDKAQDVAFDAGSSLEEADRLLTQAVMDYTGDAGRKAGKELHKVVEAKLNKWGVPQEKLNDLKDAFRRRLNTSRDDKG